MPWRSADQSFQQCLCLQERDWCSFSLFFYKRLTMCHLLRTWLFDFTRALENVFNNTSLDKQLLSLVLFSYSRVLLFRCLLCSSRISKEAEVSSVACIDEEHQCDLSVWHSCLQKEYELSLSDGGADRVCCPGTHCSVSAPRFFSGTTLKAPTMQL